jgi:hypothetical protein
LLEYDGGTLASQALKQSDYVLGAGESEHLCLHAGRVLTIDRVSQDLAGCFSDGVGGDAVRGYHKRQA